jgi:uncharacterized protein DUF4410
MLGMLSLGPLDWFYFVTMAKTKSNEQARDFSTGSSMKAGSSLLFWFCLTVFLLSTASYQGDNESHAQKLLGGVEVKDDQINSPLPQKLPGTVYIADFGLDAENYSGDEGVRGALPGKLGQRLPRRFGKENPAARARQIVDTMAESLVQRLNAKGVQAARLRNLEENLPGGGWLIQGVFTEVAEGNRLKRAGIGFAKGATSMDVQVGVSDLASSAPRAAFAIFGTVKEPSKLPGAVVTMNPYVAAAKFVLQKNASERDIQKTAGQIVEQIIKYEQQIQTKTPQPDSR